MHNKKSVKDIIILVCKLLLVVGAFTYLIATGKLTYSDLARSFEHPGFLFLGIIGAFVPMLLCFVRYHLLLLALDIDLGLREVFRLGFIGCFFNTFMLGGMGGDVVKVAYIMRDTGKKAPVIASATVDRVLGLSGMIIIGGLAMLLALDDVLATPSLHKLVVAVFSVLAVLILCSITSIATLLRNRKWGAIVWGMILVGGVYAIYKLLNGIEFNPVKSPGEIVSDEVLMRGRITLAIAGGLFTSLLCIFIMPSLQPGRSLERFISNKIPLGSNLMSFIKSLLEYQNNLGTLAISMILSLFTHGTNMTALYFFSRAVDLEQAPSFADIFFAAPVAFVANALPVPGGGAGIGETVFNELLELCRSDAGLPIVGGASIFVLWRVWYILLGLIGLPIYLKGKSKIIAAEEEYEAEMEEAKAAENQSDA